MTRRKCQMFCALAIMTFAPLLHPWRRGVSDDCFASRVQLRTPLSSLPVVRRPNLPTTSRQALGAGQLWAACAAPSCLGFWKSEYGVSYGYGTAVATSGLFCALQSGLPPVIVAHAIILVLYGCRLNAFLLYRELRIPRFREFREKIEERAKKRGGRFKRLPFILSIALLYLGLAAPVQIASKAFFAGGSDFMGLNFAAAHYRLFVKLMFIGWGLAALGDTYKLVRKAQRGENAIVTDGPYTWFRHPNYTGEQLLWTANFSAGLAAASFLRPISRVPPIVGGWLAISALGVIGINFVLMQATRGLEAKQEEKYGSDPAYQLWVSRTWKGFALPSRPALPEGAESKTPSTSNDAESMS